MECESDQSDYEERERALTMCTYTTASPVKKSLKKKNTTYTAPTDSVFSSKIRTKNANKNDV